MHQLERHQSNEPRFHVSSYYIHIANPFISQRKKRKQHDTTRQENGLVIFGQQRKWHESVSEDQVEQQVATWTFFRSSACAKLGLFRIESVSQATKVPRMDQTQFQNGLITTVV